MTSTPSAGEPPTSKPKKPARTAGAKSAPKRAAPGRGRPRDIHAADYANIFRLVPTPASITSLPDGRFLEVNDAFCRAMGYAREQVIGQTTQGLTPVIKISF
jgi:PAS domain-containing protein